MERTLILLKPDCVQRRLMGRVIARFEDKGLNIIAMKMMRVTPALAKQHYAEHVAKAWYPALEGFITGGPIVAAVVEGLEAIRVVREMLGATSGLKAAPGTDSRRLQLQPADEPGARLRRPRRGQARNRALLPRRRAVRLRADDHALAAGERRKLV